MTAEVGDPIAWRYENEHPSDWDYRDTYKWVNDYPICGGSQQSPINLESYNAIESFGPPLRFINYNAPFIKKLTIENNAHSAEIALHETVRGTRPIITGGLLEGEYEAHSAHFHWGSLLSKGSEHSINGLRYDGELHIVHKNMKYGNAHEASRHRDGIAVLSILINISDNLSKTYHGLNKVFNILPKIKQYGTNTTISQDLSLNYFLGHINTQHFYSYKGV
ncbi:carbonic anhydrase 6-like [Eurosta solidaginis]|uniref:carbonic anhydrase 6-like n=1 Tax=Eurosta solidaginis TaxID=178769 RepID=UPI0035307EAB